MSKQCDHCGFTIPITAEKLAKCPKCNKDLPASTILPPPLPTSQANAWLEMRRKAGFEARPI